MAGGHAVLPGSSICSARDHVEGVLRGERCRLRSNGSDPSPLRCHISQKGNSEMEELVQPAGARQCRWTRCRDTG